MTARRVRLVKPSNPPPATRLEKVRFVPKSVRGKVCGGGVEPLWFDKQL